MAAPVITVEVAFSTANPLTVPGSWTDISAYVRGIDIKRGRQHELGRTSAGEATVTVDNGDRRFDPTYTSGAYYPNVLPMKRLRVRAVHNAVTYDLFQGYVEDWGQEWTGRTINAQGDAETPIRVVDAFKVLNLIDVPTYQQEVATDAPFIYLPFDEDQPSMPYPNQGYSDSDFSLDFSAGNWRQATPGPLKGGSKARLNTVDGDVVSKSFVDSATARNRLKKSWTVEAWVQRGSTGNNWITVLQIGSGQNLWGGFRLGSGGQAHKVQPLLADPDSVNALRTATTAIGTGWHHVVLVRNIANATAVDYYLDGAFVETITGCSLPKDNSDATDTYIQTNLGDAGAGVQQVAMYDYALSASRIAAHYAATLGVLAAGQTVDTAIGAVLDAIGWASGDRSITTSTHTISRQAVEGKALDTLLMLGEDTEGGLMFVLPNGKLRFRSVDNMLSAPTISATWGDAGGEVNYSDLSVRYDDTDLYSEARATAATLPEQVVVDAAAATAYGPRSLDVDAGILETPNQVVDRAGAMLLRYKAPALRPESLTALDSGSDITRMAEMLNSEVGRRVTVKRRPPGGGSAMSVDCIEEGVQHTLRGVTQSWQTTLALSPALDAIPWTLADATYGVLDSTTDLGW